MKQEPKFFNLGIIGWPLSHSLSPRMHNAALRAVGIDGEYHPFPIPPLPAGEATLLEILGKVKSGEIQGLNVTIPHKQNVLKMLDSLSPEAEIIGAVNTIFVRNGRLTGDNTDWAGFLGDLSCFLPAKTESPARQALVLGAGGSARAVVYALVKTGWQVNISARRMEQARELAKVFSSRTVQIEARPLRQFAGLNTTNLIVNTTPVGMAPNIAESPWPVDVPLPKRAVLYDLIYNPSETALIKAARASGMKAVNGLGMLVEQAALAFEIWTREPTPRDVFRQSALGRNTL